MIKGTKIGILVDMFKGDLKFFINREDKGYILQNDKKLTERELFVTVTIHSSNNLGTITFVPQSH